MFPLAMAVLAQTCRLAGGAFFRYPLYVRTVPLCEVADLITGITPPRGPALYGGAIPLVRPGDLDCPGPVHTARETVTELGARQGRLLPAGAVLVSCIGRLGKIGLLGGPAITNQQITALIPRPGILPEYVFYWAQTLRPWLDQSASATTLPIVNKRRLGRAPFPLASPAEQQRMVVALRAAHQRHHDAATALAAIPALLGQLRRSLIAAALEGELGPSSRSARARPQVVRLGSVARVQAGYPFRSGWFADAGVRLLRGVNVAPGALTWTQRANLPEAMAARYGSYVLRPGDVVIGLDRPVIAAGLRVAKLETADVPALLVQRVGRFVACAGASLDSDYLLLCLQSESMLAHLEGRATGTQLPHISPAAIEAAPLPLPALSVQRAIVKTSAALGQQVAAAAAQHAAAQQRLDELWQALLVQAFGGAGPGIGAASRS